MTTKISGPELAYSDPIFIFEKSNRALVSRSKLVLSFKNSRRRSWGHGVLLQRVWNSCFKFCTIFAVWLDLFVFSVVDVEESKFCVVLKRRILSNIYKYGIVVYYIVVPWLYHLEYCNGRMQNAWNGDNFQTNYLNFRHLDIWI